MDTNAILSPPKLIKQNHLLHSLEKTLALADVLALRKVAEMGATKLGRQLNLAHIPEDLVHRVNAIYGGEGLFQLMMLAMGHEDSEFNHFVESLKWILMFEEIAMTNELEPLRYEDSTLKQSEKLRQFNTNVIQPSLSRKLYRAGCHHGSLVYGIGGPRILVSHPFQGRTEDVYDVYTNSVDVVTSLCLRGYRGAFHFLDYIPGLNHEIQGIPAWLLWFSIIAVHSDLVIYVKEYEEDFQLAQKLEIEMTPDRVKKTVVSIPHEELRWAKKADFPHDLRRIYIGHDGVMSEEDWFRMEAEHAAPFIQNYTRRGIPGDRLIVLDESGSITQYPLDYPLYDRPVEK